MKTIQNNSKIRPTNPYTQILNESSRNSTRYCMLCTGDGLCVFETDQQFFFSFVTSRNSASSEHVL